MLVVALTAAAAFRVVRALPQSGPSPVLSARQQVVTNADGVTKTVQQNAGPNTAVTIGATAAIILGFIALVLFGVWVGSWRRRKNKEWQRSMAQAQQETKNLNRLTMRSQRPGSVPTTPTSSIGSGSKIDRKSSALSLAPSTTSSFASSGVPPIVTTPPQEQRRPTVLHQPSPRTPSNLVQNSLLHQHSEYPPPSHDRSDSLNSNPPEMNRTSFYSQQPSRPSPLSNSVTLPPSEAGPPSQPTHSFQPPSGRSAGERNATTSPPTSRSPPSFQPPQRKSRADANLTIVIPPSRQAVPRAPPGLENGGDASANSMRSAEMGRAR